MTNKIKFCIALLASAIVFVSLSVLFYLYALPAIVSNANIMRFVEKNINAATGLELKIVSPCLKTSFSPKIYFSVKEIALNNGGSELLSIKNLDTGFSLKNLFSKKIIVEKAGLDYFFADINKLMEISSAQGEAKPGDWSFDLFESEMYLKKCLILYKPAKDALIKISGDDLEITASRNPKYVRFKLDVDILRGKNSLKFAAKDNDRIYIKDHKLFVDNFVLNINNSKIVFNAVSDKKNNFNLDIVSDNFDADNAVRLISSNLVIPNGSEIMSFFKDIKGTFNFNIKMTNKGINGLMTLNNLALKVIPVNNLPLVLQKGNVKISNNIITLNDFSGYYGKNKNNNKINFFGDVKNYTTLPLINIEATGIASKEFSKDYLSKVIGYPVELTHNSGTKLLIKSQGIKTDLTWMFKLAKGHDFLVDGASLSPVNYDRALKADMHFVDTMLNIESINYYIAQEIVKGSKVKPILTISGNVDLAAANIKNLGFVIPKPLPSEFLNVLAGQKIFKKGTILGNLQIVNTGKYPVLDGDFTLDKVRIPSQRLYIKNANLSTDTNNIKLNARGKYKRSDYNLAGSLKNGLILPIVVNDINLTVDNIDVQKILNSFNKQNTDQVTGIDKNSTQAANEMQNDDAVAFDTGLLLIEKCSLNVVKGVYKDINFGNIKANMTLDKNGVLEVKSNRFDIAEGHSSLKVFCDLKNHIYDLKLGAKDINSDIMAASLLDLKKEISGKGSGIIHIHTDNSLKLNGIIKFVVKDGTIGKIGLIEYALKFAALFRNPMAMISPSTFVDLVNIPEGNFEKISGDLTIKDNVIEKIIIKSSSPQLSSFIAGRFDLEKRDATLRIYTKFSSKNKGFSGFMRNFSLNSLANRVPIGSRNDSNYYSAELSMLPPIDADEKDCQVFLTKVDGDVERNNFLSSLKKIK